MERCARLLSRSPQETHEQGYRLGELLEPGHVIGLVGELGAGKTCLVAGTAAGLGVDPSVYVSSPTYTLVNEYRGRILLVHMDFYRLASVEEIVELGVEELYGGPGACVVEWFDKFPAAAPAEHLVVELSITGPGSRAIALRPRGERYARLAAAWAGTELA